MPIVLLAGLFLLFAAPFLLRGAGQRSLTPLREAGLGIAGGAIAGLAWGAGARLVMRVVAMVDGRETSVSAGGIAIVLISGVVLGALLGLAFMTARRWLPPGVRGRGLAFGLALLLLGVAPITALGAADLESGGWLQPAVLTGSALFALLFIGYGLALAAIVARLERGRVRATQGAPLPVA